MDAVIFVVVALAWVGAVVIAVRGVRDRDASSRLRLTWGACLAAMVLGAGATAAGALLGSGLPVGESDDEVLLLSSGGYFLALVGLCATGVVAMVTRSRTDG